MENMSKLKKLWLLFINTFLISASTNGGYAIVSVMKTKFVGKYKWLQEDEMLDLLSIGQSVPGPIAINTSVLVGYRVAGVFGSLVTLLGTALPPLIIMCFVSVFYSLINTNVYVRAFMKAMQPGVAALLISISYDLFVGLKKNNNVIVSYILMVICFLIVEMFDISIFYIAILAGVSGFIYMKKGVTHE